MSEKEKRKTGMKSSLWRNLALMLAILLIPPIVTLILTLSLSGELSDIFYPPNQTFDWQWFFWRVTAMNSFLPITVIISIIGYLYLIRRRWFFVFGLIPQLLMIGCSVLLMFVESTQVLGTVELNMLQYQLIHSSFGGNRSLRIAVCEENTCQAYPLIVSDTSVICFWNEPCQLYYDAASDELIIDSVVEEITKQLSSVRIKVKDLPNGIIASYGSLWDERKSEA